MLHIYIYIFLAIVDIQKYYFFCASVITFKHKASICIFLILKVYKSKSYFNLQEDSFFFVRSDHKNRLLSLTFFFNIAYKHLYKPI